MNLLNRKLSFAFLIYYYFYISSMGICAIKFLFKDYFSGMPEFLICYIFIFIQFKIISTWPFDLFFNRWVI